MIIDTTIGERGLTDHYPELGTGPVSTEPYYSEAHYELEKQRLFRRTWLSIGRVEQVAEPGDYFVFDLAVADTSILVVRGEDNQIRGFHNMCSHRGNKLMWEEKGSSMAFPCRLHGWTYLTDGSLRSVPDENMFYDLDKTRCGLTPVDLDVHEGFIFINMQPEPHETLAEYLGDVGKRMRGFPFGKATVRYAYRAELRCNWKVSLDAFCEGYHVMFLHKKWGRETFTTPGNPLCQFPYAGISGRHAVAAVTGNPDYKPRPAEAKIYEWATKLQQNNESDGSWLPPGVNPHDSPEFSFELMHLFPNYLVHLVEGTYFTHQFWPLSPDRTLWEGCTYYEPADNAAERFRQEHLHLLRRESWLEDTRAMESVQAMLKSGAKDEFIFHDHEVLLRHTYKTVMDYVKDNAVTS